MEIRRFARVENCSALRIFLQEFCGLSHPSFWPMIPMQSLQPEKAISR
jgi:hypothetical protein